MTSDLSDSEDDTAGVARLDPLIEFFVSSEERQGEAGAGTVAFEIETAAAEQQQLLAFWVADEEYAVEIGEIQEIIKVPEVTEVPRVDPSVRGITSLRGTIVPILDLRTVLQLSEAELTREARVLVMRGDGDPVGLLVDRVTSVVRLDPTSIEPTPATMQRATSDMVIGVGRLEEQMLIILDIRTVLAVMERVG